MTSIALLGAGGKMGHRLARNLRNTCFDVRHVEVSDAGRARLRDDKDVIIIEVPFHIDEHFIENEAVCPPELVADQEEQPKAEMAAENAETIEEPPLN